MQEETTVHPSAPDITYVAPVLTRQQRRHARQELEYRQAIQKQGTRYIKGYHVNPKGLPHVGAKQRAKMERKNK